MICENMSIWCWLIPAVVGLICAILGYLLGRLFGKNSGNSEANYKSKISKLEADLAYCESSKTNSDDLEAKHKHTISKLKASLADCKASKNVAPASNSASKTSSLKTSSSNSFAASAASTTASASTFDAAAAKLVFGKKIKENDLKIVEGIGPKIEGLFHNHDVKTWKALSECSIEKCQEVLNSGGDRYRMHKPTTWAKQAGLASEGKWKELLKWQDKLDGGK